MFIEMPINDLIVTISFKVREASQYMSLFPPIYFRIFFLEKQTIQSIY